jgi:hypothetical protein
MGSSYREYLYIAYWGGEMNITEKLSPIFTEIVQEHIRQDEKWGEQNHPMLGMLTSDLCLYNATIYKEINAIEGARSWLSILMEEVYEAFAETDPEKQREEMIQVAAVAIQIVEYLDRRIKEVTG